MVVIYMLHFQYLVFKCMNDYHIMFRLNIDIGAQNWKLESAFLNSVVGCTWN
jgi:hypothetical protein